MDVFYGRPSTALSAQGATTQGSPHVSYSRLRPRLDRRPRPRQSESSACNPPARSASSRIVISGKTFDRPGLADLLDYIRPGDTLAVVRLDRLGRSLRELLDVVETLKKRGVALLSLEEKIDISSADRRSTTTSSTPRCCS